jgi:hypothetical protein
VKWRYFADDLFELRAISAYDLGYLQIDKAVTTEYIFGQVLVVPPFSPLRGV